MSESKADRGAEGERLAARHLEQRGYRIVERNFRCRAGEIDIIARDGDTLVFVEVRTRSSDRHGGALETIGVAKQAQIVKVARVYLQTRRPAFDDCRFDVIGITAGQIELVTDAFRLGD